MATCWNLLSCDPETHTDKLYYTQTDLTVYEGQYVYIDGEEDLIYQVVPNNEDEVLCEETEYNPILSIVIVPNCDQSCGCPDGFTYSADENLCIREISQPATQNPDNYEVEAAQDVVSYGNAGGVFYPLLDGLFLPIKRFDALPQLYETNGTPYNLDPDISPNPIFLVWQQRLNNTGIWNPSIPIEEWTGFSACVDIPQTAVYTIGIAADNRCRFRINGQEIFTTEDTDSNTWNFRYWHLFPITLFAGQNIIEMEGYNEGSQAAFAAEIYNTNTQTLSLLETQEELAPYILFSTVDKIGELFDIGETVGYSCPDGYSLSNCSGEVSCVLRLEAPYSPCCIQLEDCSGVLEDLYVRETFEVPINAVVKLQEYPETCWLVVERRVACVGESVLVNLVEVFSTCATCAQDDFNTEVPKIVPEPVEPGFDTKFCDEEKTIQRYCDFADSIYSTYKNLKYGIQGCCEYDHMMIDIRFQIMRLQELYDPELCTEVVISIINPCTPEPEPIVCPSDISIN